MYHADTTRQRACAVNRYRLSFLCMSQSAIHGRHTGLQLKLGPCALASSAARPTKRDDESRAQFHAASLAHDVKCRTQQKKKSAGRLVRGPCSRCGRLAVTHVQALWLLSAQTVAFKVWRGRLLARAPRSCITILPAGLQALMRLTRRWEFQTRNPYECMYGACACCVCACANLSDGPSGSDRIHQL